MGKKDLLSHLRQSQKFKQLERLFETPTEDRDPSWLFTVGEATEGLCPKKDRKYGQNCIGQLATALGGTASMETILWSARDCADTFARDDVKRLSNRKKTNGHRVTQNHLRLFSSVRDEDDRKELEEECIANRWSVAKLRSAVHERQGKLSRGGVQPAKPNSPSEALNQIIDHTSSWLGRYKKVWFESPDSTLQRPMAKRQARTLACDIEETIQLLAELEKSAKRLRMCLKDQLTGDIKTAGVRKRDQKRAKSPRKKPRRS